MKSTTAVISYEAFCHNVALVRQHLPKTCSLMAVIKADAYGHGAVTLANWATEQGAAWLCVARAFEACQLRHHGIQTPLLILQPVLTPDELSSMDSLNGVAFTAGDAAHLALLETAAARASTVLDVHIKVDTGMHRIGFAPEQLPALTSFFARGRLRFAGLFTHYAMAEDNAKFTRLQYSRFMQAKKTVRDMGFSPMCHTANTAATLQYPELAEHGVRVGLALYGYSTTALPLRPILSWRAPVVQLQTLMPGDGTSYGWQFIAEKTTRIATVGVGYADGYARELGCARGHVLLHGQPAPVLGAVCMDQMIVDVTDIPQTRIGDDVWLLRPDAGLTAETMAEWRGTIGYEVLCGIAPRVGREYVG